MTPVSVRLFAGAAEAFGTDEAELEDVTDLASVVESLKKLGDDRLGEVLEQCSFFVDGEHRNSLAGPVPGGARVDVLPPFAGG